MAVIRSRPVIEPASLYSFSGCRENNDYWIFKYAQVVARLPEAETAADIPNLFASPNVMISFISLSARPTLNSPKSSSSPLRGTGYLLDMETIKKVCQILHPLYRPNPHIYGSPNINIAKILFHYPRYHWGCGSYHIQTYFWDVFDNGTDKIFKILGEAVSPIAICIE